MVTTFITKALEQASLTANNNIQIKSTQHYHHKQISNFILNKILFVTKGTDEIIISKVTEEIVHIKAIKIVLKLVLVLIFLRYQI